MRQLMCQNKLKLRLTGRQIVRQQYEFLKKEKKAAQPAMPPRPYFPAD